jgi:hypothetical protein
MQLLPELLTRGLPPPEPHSLCPQLNLLNPPPKKIPGNATDWHECQHLRLESVLAKLSSALKPE